MPDGTCISCNPRIAAAPARTGSLRWRLHSVLVLSVISVGSPPAELHAQWDSPSTYIWGATGTMLVGAALLDPALRDEWRGGEHPRFDTFADLGNALGRTNVVVPALGAVYGAGWLLGHEELSRATLHTAAALVAAGAAGGAIKVAVGRERPGENGSTSFRPFSLYEDEWQAFPSGHAVVAFALATAVSEEADRPWVTAVSYSAAGLVGWSRIYEDRHWTSDVVAGAVVGTLAAKFTLRQLHARSVHGSPTSAVRFAVAPGGFGISLPAR